MDLYLGKLVYEKFTDATPPTTTTPPTATAPATPATAPAPATPTATKWTAWSVIGSIISFAIMAAFGSWAAYLSWQANSLAGWGMFGKGVFSFFAFFNGLGYLVSYFIMKYDLVQVINAISPQVTKAVGGRKR